MADRIIKPGEMIFRRLDPEDLVIASINEATRTIWHPITREVKDRMGDIVRIDGANLKEFKKKPGVLYGHDYRSFNPIPVIAENIGFKKDGDRLMAGTRFLPVDTPGMSQGLKDLINDNWLLQAKKLLGWSMGFMPDPEATEEIKEDGHFKGYDFKKWTLLEYSSVIIPANQGAINDAMKGGTISGAVIKYFDMSVKKGAEIDGTPVEDAPDEIVMKPLPNNHACRLEDPGKYSKFRTGTRNHKGKEYSIIFGEPKDGGGWEEQSYRYATDAWTPDEAKTHCKSHGGTFEPASGKAVEPCADCAAKVEDVLMPASDLATASATTIIPELVIPKTEPQITAPADDIHESKPNEGGTQVLEKILDKINKGEELTPDEKAFWAKFQTAMAPKPAAEPVRKLELGDAGGVKVRSITDIMNEVHGSNTGSGPLNEVESELQRFSENAYIVATILGKSPRQLKMWDNYLGRSSALRKAMDATTAAEGLEWVPTLLSADFITRFRLEAKVASLFPDFAMPSNPWKMPYFAGMGASNFYYVGESISDEVTASPPTTPATGDQTLTAKKLKSRIYFSDELTEDSILPVISVLRSEMVKAGAEVVEDIVLNGDVTATHQDSDVTDSKDRRKAWSGLRKLCPTATKGSLATFTAASHIAAFIILMGKYGINPADLAFITGGVGYNKFRALTEVMTVDKYGPSAVVLNGELGKLFGSPIIVSEYIRENLNATGVYDGTTTTKTQVLIVNKQGFMLGTRGGVKLTFKQEAEVDQNQLIMSFRKAFQPRWTPSASVLTIANGYNVA